MCNGASFHHNDETGSIMSNVISILAGSHSGKPCSQNSDTDDVSIIELLRWLQELLDYPFVMHDDARMLLDDARTLHEGPQILLSRELALMARKEALMDREEALITWRPHNVPATNS